MSRAVLQLILRLIGLLTVRGLAESLLSEKRSSFAARVGIGLWTAAAIASALVTLLWKGG